MGCIKTHHGQMSQILSYTADFFTQSYALKRTGERPTRMTDKVKLKLRMLEEDF